MKKILNFLLSLVMVTGIIANVSVPVLGASVNDLRFTLNDNGASYAVTDCRITATGELVIPDVYNNLPVTSIETQAFEECEDITSVVIPGSVMNIEEQAFKDCIGLESVTIQDGVLNIGEKAFFGCESLVSVIIPDSVKRIGNGGFEGTELYENSDNWENDVLYVGNHLISAKGAVSGDCYIKEGTKTIAEWAFAGCESLGSIEIPDAITSIGEYAFYDCTELYSISLPAHYIQIGYAAFYRSGYYYDSFNWDNGILYIDNHLIANESGSSETYEIKSGTISVADKAFAYCKNMKSINIPDSVLGIGNSAFEGCSSLEKVSFGKNLKTIGDLAFSGTKIISIKLPVNIETIGREALTTVESAIVPKNIKYIGAKAFGSGFKYLFYTGSETEWKKVIIDSDNSYLFDSAIHYNSTDHTLVDGFCKKCDYSWFVFRLFEDDYYGESYYELDYCRTIAKGDIVIPRKYKGLPVRWIDGYAFQDCKQVTSVVIPKGVVRINKGTFLRCSNLKSVTIPDSVTLIDEAAFYKCDKFSEIYYLGSAKKWNEILIKSYNKELLNAKLHCVPARPGLKSVANTTTGIKFSWYKVTGADNYDIYRKTGSGKWTKIATVKSTVTTYTDKTVKSGTTYKYTVKAKNEMGVSKYNTTGLTLKCIADPVLKTPTSAKSGITLKWSKVTGANGYIVYRKAGSGSYSKLATVKGVSKVSYVDKSAKKNKTYTYRVKAYYGKTYSAYSNAKTIKDKY